MMTPSEQARRARAELETLAASLRVHELAQLVALGRRLLAQQADDAGADDDPSASPAHARR